MAASELNFIRPKWPAPPHVNAIVTTRQGGYSKSIYSSFNLGAHVEDKPQHVEQNRQLLIEQLHLPQSPYWLQQTHSDTVLTLPPETSHTVLNADASYTNTPNVVCAILTADCLPILICDTKGSTVAAIHAGWRGLAQDIIPKTINTLTADTADLMAWLGPAISVQHFEVGAEVYQQFCSAYADNESAFIAGKQGKWYADLYQLARLSLQRCGVHAIFGGEYCTFSDDTLFYSYRRDGVTGRQASLIWLSEA